MLFKYFYLFKFQFANQAPQYPSLRQPGQQPQQPPHMPQQPLNMPQQPPNMPQQQAAFPQQKFDQPIQPQPGMPQQRNPNAAPIQSQNIQQVNPPISSDSNPKSNP